MSNIDKACPSYQCFDSIYPNNVPTTIACFNFYTKSNILNSYHVLSSRGLHMLIALF